MKTMLAVMVVAMGLGAAACSPGAVSVDKAKCQTVVLVDTARLFATEHTVMMSTSSDTVPKPHATCLTLYAQASDTLPKPKP